MVEKDSSQPDAPERIGGHEIVGLLGQGPRGAVHLGKESSDAAPVAIKTLNADADPDADFVARLKSVTRVSSSYVARTLDAGLQDGLPYVVREHVEGRSLAATVTEDGPLTGDALERVAVGMLTALTAVHLAGFAHRGLTPYNVILTDEGLRVTDIEIGDPAGEVGYRAPEQINGLQYGPYADVFAWAATVVFAATGAAPFGQDAHAVLSGEPELGGLSGPLRQVVLAGLAKDVAGRPTTYTALLRLLGDDNAPMPVPPIEGVPVPPLPAQATLIEGQPMPPGAQPPLLPMAIEGNPMPQGPMPPGLIGQGPMQGIPMQPGPMQPGPMQPGPMPHGPMPPVPMQQGPLQPGPLQQGPMQPGVMHEGPMSHPPVPVQPTWGPPSGPQSPPQEPPQGWVPQGAVPGQRNGEPPRRPFPIGLVAGVAVVVLLSALGLWGASRYSSNVTFEPAAAAASTQAQGDAGAQQAVPTQPQAEVTAPWAATPSPDDSGVGPLVLPTDAPEDTPEVPVLTSVPTPPVTQPAVVPTAVPTVAPTVKPTAAQPKQTKKAKPTATVTKTVKPSKTPTPTQKPTTEKPAETKEPTQAPTPTKTTAAPKTTAPKTTAPAAPKTTAPAAPKTNPYSAAQVCGSGFAVQRSSSFNGGATYQLYNNSTGQNCVVTLKSGANVGKSTPVSATLEVQNGDSRTDSGNYEYYAGPVKLPAKGKCVRYSGGAGSANTSAGWANCG